MKKKFNPSAALGYKRIKPLYDKAVSDLVIAEADLAECQDSRDFFYDKVCHQKKKLKYAGYMVGRLLQERKVAISEITALTQQLVADQLELVKARDALLKERKHRGVSMNQRAELHSEVNTLRDVAAVHLAARGKSEREKLSALADVQKLKSAKRKWEIAAGVAVGLVITGVIRLVQMGLI